MYVITGIVEYENFAFIRELLILICAGEAYEYRKQYSYNV